MHRLRLPSFALPALLFLLGATSWGGPAAAQAPAAGFYLGGQGSYQRYPGLEMFLDATPPAPAAVFPAAFCVGYGFGTLAAVELTYTPLWVPTRRYTSGSSLVELSRRASFAALVLRKQVPLNSGAGPWALELLGGMGPLAVERQELVYDQSGPQPVLMSSSGQGINDFLGLFGIGATYRLAPHWQLTAEGQAQLSGLRLVFSSAGYGSASSALGGGVSAGVRYWLRGQPSPVRGH